MKAASLSTRGNIPGTGGIDRGGSRDRFFTNQLIACEASLGSTISSGVAIHRPTDLTQSGVLAPLTADPAPLLASVMIGGFIRVDTTAGGFSITTDSATNIIDALPAIIQPGDWFRFVLESNSGPPIATLMVAGPDVTLLGSALVTTSGTWHVVITSLTTVLMDRVAL